jgi:hypothetical protein
MTMKITFAAHNAIANRRAHNIMNRGALIEGIGMLNQDALNVLRFIEENAREWPKVDAAHIGSASHALKETQAVSGKIG